MERQQELIRGSVAAVVYQNEENGYAVIRLAAESGETITVVGSIPKPEELTDRARVLIRVQGAVEAWI